MKKRILALMLLLSCFCLSSCQLPEAIQTALTDGTLAVVAEKAEETGADTLARQFIDGILANDTEACLAAMADGVTMEALLEVLPKLQAMLPTADSYTLTPMHFSFNTSNGVTQTTIQFRMEMNGQFFLVQTLQVSGTERLYNIHIAPVAANAGDASEASEPFTIFTALSFLLTTVSCAVTLWALIHCIRHKVPHKWLWVLLVLLGSVLLSLSYSGSHLSFRFNLGLYLLSSQISVAGSGFALKLVLPIGPVIYLIRRNSLTAQSGIVVPQDISGEPDAAPLLHTEEDNEAQEDHPVSEEV